MWRQNTRHGHNDLGERTVKNRVIPRFNIVPRYSFDKCQLSFLSCKLRNINRGEELKDTKIKEREGLFLFIAPHIFADHCAISNSSTKSGEFLQYKIRKNLFHAFLAYELGQKKKSA